MSYLLTCPNCGVREVTDFGYGGDTRTNDVHWTALPDDAPAAGQPEAQVPAGNTGGEATLA